MKFDKKHIENVQNEVLKYLENDKRVNPERFTILGIFGVKATDVIKYIKRPEACGTWPFDFVHQVDCAISKIYAKYIIDFPVIPPKNDVDDFIAKMFSRNGTIATLDSHFFEHEVTLPHMIKYLERDSEIFTWNAYFILYVQSEYKRCIEKLA